MRLLLPRNLNYWAGLSIVDSRVVQWLATARIWAQISCAVSHRLFEVTRSMPQVKEKLRVYFGWWAASCWKTAGTDSAPPWPHHGRSKIRRVIFVAIFVLFISYSRNNSINSKNQGYKWICGTQITRVIFFIFLRGTYGHITYDRDYQQKEKQVLSALLQKVKQTKTRVERCHFGISYLY